MLPGFEPRINTKRESYFEGIRGFNLSRCSLWIWTTNWQWNRTLFVCVRGFDGAATVSWQK